MQIAMITANKQEEELGNRWKNEPLQIFSVAGLSEIKQPVDAVFDFLYIKDPERDQMLHELGSVVFVNDVCGVLDSNPFGFIRFNGWNSLIQRDMLEIATTTNSNPGYQQILEKLNWPFITVPDIPGMITPRVIGMIVNEAYFALEEGVSTKKEIDLAMQLGTNYPEGPFVWSEKIGIKEIYKLLSLLSVNDKRYRVAMALQTDAEK
jgi:3-hydroxybutyryl-CoA dehydrogenase